MLQTAKPNSKDGATALLKMIHRSIPRKIPSEAGPNECKPFWERDPTACAATEHAESPDRSSFARTQAVLPKISTSLQWVITAITTVRSPDGSTSARTLLLPTGQILRRLGIPLLVASAHTDYG